MSIAEKLQTIAENEQKVFDAGKQAEYDAFWDALQDYGNRKIYNYAFMYWNCEYIRPKYKIAPTDGRMPQMFQSNKSLKKVEAKYFDFSNLPIATTATYGNYYTFQACSSLEEIEDIGMPSDFYNNTFHDCGKLHTIAKLGSKESTTFSNTFFGCSSLENITIDGVIGNNFDIHWSEKLTPESLMSIIGALKHYRLSENIITYPYYETDKTENGLTWIVNDDGSIRCYGSASYDIDSFALYRNELGMDLQAGKYYVDTGSNIGACMVIVYAEFDNNLNFETKMICVTNNDYLTLEKDAVLQIVAIAPEMNAEIDTIFYPQLCKVTDSGTTKTCTLGAANLANLTDADKAIATQKGWTLA